METPSSVGTWAMRLLDHLEETRSSVLYEDEKITIHAHPHTKFYAVINPGQPLKVTQNISRGILLIAERPHFRTDNADYQKCDGVVINEYGSPRLLRSCAVALAKLHDASDNRVRVMAIEARIDEVLAEAEKKGR